MTAADTILEHLRAGQAPATIAELVDATGLHENAVRRNLTRLIDAGTVYVERAPGSGGRGRPALRYRAAGEPETPYRALMPLLLRLLRGADVGRDAAYRAGLAHGLAQAPTGAPREAVMSSLAAMGFAPADATQASAPPGTADLELRACPFADMVTQPGGRQLCALHHGILAGVAGARGGAVTRFDVVDPNAGHCVLHLGPAAGADQAGGGSAPSARADSRKASPRSS